MADDTQTLRRSTLHFGEVITGMIFAADINDEEACIAMCKAVRKHVDVVKLASPLIYKYGMSVASRVARATDLPVFLDIKVADVPHTDRQIIELASQAGAAAVMVHGYLGPDAVAACMEAADDRLGIIVQGELTHPGGEVFSAAIADDIAVMARALGTFGVQAPGNRPERVAAIRRIVGPEQVIVCCGVGAQGGTYGQVRTAGADYAIVGRAIYEAQHPVAKIAELKEQGW